MRVKKRKKRSKVKRYHITVSRTSLCLWAAGLFFVLAWIFVLGILVGRGFIPQGMQNLVEFKDRMAGLGNFADHDGSSELEQIKGLEKDPEFGFYKTLSNTDDERATKVVPEKEQKGKPTKPAEEPPSPPSEADYTVQLAALENGLHALKMVSRLVEHGYPAYFNAASVNGRPRYRVRCGRFASRREAREMAAVLAREEKLTGFVTRHKE
jgi:hypothetical protein